MTRNAVPRFALLAAGAAALAAPALPQQSDGQAGDRRAQVFTAAKLQQQLGSLAAPARQTGSSGATLGDYGSHALKLSLRGASGGAEIHAHFDDVMVITGGSATLVTGGTVIDAQSGADGETKGKGIRGGVRRKIAKGDLVHIPAGTPHQLLIDPGAARGTLFSAIVVKVRE